MGWIEYTPLHIIDLDDSERVVVSLSEIDGTMHVNVGVYRSEEGPAGPYYRTCCGLHLPVDKVKEIVSAVLHARASHFETAGIKDLADELDSEYSL